MFRAASKQKLRSVLNTVKAPPEGTVAMEKRHEMHPVDIKNWDDKERSPEKKITSGSSVITTPVN